MTQTLCLLNPNAQGGRLRRRASALRQAVAKQAPAAVWEQPESVETAQDLIRRLPRGSRVLAFGGDGTVNRWLPALLEGGHTLGLVPLGSGNDLARALGVFGMPWAEALECALTSPASLMDVGTVELARPQDPTYLAGTGSTCCNVPFLSSLAVGFDASVGLRAQQGPRWLRGQPRYLWATLRELMQLRSWNLELSAEVACASEGQDSLRWHGRVLLASTLNTRSYGSGMPAAPEARIDDGRLDLLRAQAMGRAGVLTLLPRLLRGIHLSDPRVSLQTFQTLQVQAHGPVPLAVDGEYLGAFNRFAVSVLPGRLPVVIATKSLRFGK